MAEMIPVHADDVENIRNLSALAEAIVREHFDPIIGREQNDYMISLFQTPQAITRQLQNGYRYYFVREATENIGFLAFYPKHDVMYLSKFYLRKEERGKGIAHQMLAFVKQETKKEGLPAVELNVNRNNSACLAYEKMGFRIVREEKNDIGKGFYMDDYVYRLDLEPEFAVKTFDELTADEVYEIIRSREEIFVVEQNCPYQETDGTDRRSIHVFSRNEEGRVTSYLRIFAKDKETNTVQIGRVLTLKHGTGLGGKLLKKGIEIAEERMNAETIYIEAQTYAAGYYAREGFVITSGEFLEDGIPHVQMERKKK